MSVLIQLDHYHTRNIPWMWITCIFCIHHSFTLLANDSACCIPSHLPMRWTFLDWWCDPQYLLFGLVYMVAYDPPFLWFLSLVYVIIWHQILYFWWGCLLGLSYLCPAALLAHANTCSLVAELVSMCDITSCLISTIMPSPFKPLMNCSFKHLSKCLYLHYATLYSESAHPFFIFIPTA